ncbi:hypothetical protein [Salibacterium halotolerans]|uniref:Activator of Hsp90 ATPase homolog 1-like protein n=1 Tax=Salibacterium halotolerans TaxID=1884432 RepID=A0A1I5KWC3_9BACI|nr:hypothetical protein [Salibacterium halotolerans]SFO89399.1 hypothetical protein SAMN05518683_10113 [Salibacterium halotolerans]
MSNVIRFEKQRTVHVPVEDLWDFLSDSNHLNIYNDIIKTRR